MKLGYCLAPVDSGGEGVRKLTARGRGDYFWGGAIVAVLMIAFFAVGAWLWGVFALLVAALEFGIVAMRMRRDESEDAKG